MEPTLSAVDPQPTSVRRRHAGSRVRPLTAFDMRGVAELHLAAFGSARRIEDVEQFLGNVFFGHPWLDNSLPSLGCEDAEGRLVGCLGVMPRPMQLHGEPVRAVVAHNFIVDASGRAGLAAIELLQAFHRLSADVALFEANAAGRRIAEALGAEVVDARSTRWVRALSPFAFAARLVGEDCRGVLAGVVRGLARLGDFVVGRLPGIPLRPPRVDGRTGPLDAALLGELLERHTADTALRPVYTVASLEWLLSTLRASRRNQYVRARVVLDGAEALGWFIYYSRPGGIGRVLQMGSLPEAGARRDVLAHLLSDAANDGNVGVSGASDPAWTSALTAYSCFVREGTTWLMVGSSKAEFRSLLESPRAFFGRLEGEGWLRFAF